MYYMFTMHVCFLAKQAKVIEAVSIRAAVCNYGEIRPLLALYLEEVKAPPPLKQFINVFQRSVSRFRQCREQEDEAEEGESCENEEADCKSEITI